MLSNKQAFLVHMAQQRAVDAASDTQVEQDASIKRYLLAICNADDEDKASVYRRVHSAYIKRHGEPEPGSANAAAALLCIEAERHVEFALAGIRNGYNAYCRDILHDWLRTRGLSRGYAQDDRDYERRFQDLSRPHYTEFLNAVKSSVDIWWGWIPGAVTEAEHRFAARAAAMRQHIEATEDSDREFAAAFAEYAHYFLQIYSRRFECQVNGISALDGEGDIRRRDHIEYERWRFHAETFAAYADQYRSQLTPLV
jgi:hypothetical protein